MGGAWDLRYWWSRNKLLMRNHLKMYRWRNDNEFINNHLKYPLKNMAKVVQGKEVGHWNMQCKKRCCITTKQVEVIGEITNNLEINGLGISILKKYKSHAMEEEILHYNKAS